ncbi:double-stranded RNA-specific adenosine deaminase-like [Megalobrama amblycephala]|uniref:double-stranded RNA-specific adenosine deaminase-like n=1 Tax=Megalobrama amblycephala TaxID=75352 RepID=UPI002013DF6F|nr:double-stranded RNA-specific adenosine deaminase-like [Megalobrama amblycephala]
MERPVSAIYAFGQRKGLEVAFIVEAPSGPEHVPRFTARARVGREQFPEGSGSSKKAAREAAAQAALEELRRRGPLPERRSSRRPGLLECLCSQPLSGLQRYACAHGKELRIEFVEQTGPPNARRFSYRVKLGGHTFLPMSASSKRQAREEAARAAVAVLVGEAEREARTPPPQPSTSSSPPSPPTTSTTSVPSCVPGHKSRNKDGGGRFSS